jgi:branched-chain amino acid transport system permease protein
MQILMNGLNTGLVTALTAVAFAIVYLPTRVLHVGLAGVYAITPYVAWSARRMDLSWPATIAVSLSVGAVLSWLCEKTNHSPLQTRRASNEAHFISALGLYLLISEGTAIVWGSETKVLRTGLDRSWAINAVELTYAQLVTAGTAIGILVLFFVGLKKTNIGVQLRAMADNPTQFGLTGRNVTALRAAAFALSGLIGAVAALVNAYDLGFDYRSGLTAILLALVSVIVGGHGAFGGIVAGALLLGLLRAQIVWHLGARWQDAATFLILALVLFIRPQGLFGRPQRLEAQA